MRRAPSVDASRSPSLHPTLQAALGSLDVQLEAELTRYRRQRHLHRRRQHDAKPMSLIAVQAIGGRTQPQSPASPPAPVPAPVAEDPWQAELPAPLAIRSSSPAIEAASLRAADLQMAAIASVRNSNAPDPVTVLQPDLPDDEREPDDYLASSEELLRSLAEEEADLRRQRQAKGSSKLLTPLGIGSLLLLLSSATLGYLILNPGTIQNWRLDRFWRSPEPVSVAPSPTASEPVPSAAPSPDLSSEEFRDLNLDTLSTLPVTPSPTALPTASATAIAPAPRVATAQTEVPTTTVRPPAVPARPAAIASPSPMPRVPIARRPTSVAPPAQRAPRQTARYPSASSRSTPSRQAPSRPAARPPQPPRSTQQAARPLPRPAAPPPAAPPPAAPPPPSPTAERPSNPARYVVVSPFSGDRSLEQAQQVVGDAYVRNSANGAQVQYGAFSDGDRARELRSQLQQQGIPAQVVEAGGN